MRVLVIGNGAREHALCAALDRDPSVDSVVCAPGNAGTALVADNRPVDVLDPAACAALAAEVAPDLVIVGPEAPLVAGVADAVRERGFAVFGPSAAAARLEGSKAFAKDVMAAAGVPTAAARAHTDVASALAHLADQRPPYVVKYDGLAAGKGVTVTADLPTAEEAVRSSLRAAGDTVVIEDYLDGPEVSLFAVTDGTTVLPMVPAQDFKRIYDGDEGPNTGGMGAYSPLPWLDAGFVDEAMERVLVPTVREMSRRGTPFSGLLYAGFAVTRDGMKIVEFNARFGDPETQVVLARLRTPLGGVLHAAATGTLADVKLEWDDLTAVNVVIAAGGYPGPVEPGTPIRGLAEASGVPGASVLHAGTALRDGEVVTAGGRVLSVVGTGATLAAARDVAYRAAALIDFDGMQLRRDIAEKAAAEAR